MRPRRRIAELPFFSLWHMAKTLEHSDSGAASSRSPCSHSARSASRAMHASRHKLASAARAILPTEVADFFPAAIIGVGAFTASRASTRAAFLFWRFFVLPMTDGRMDGRAGCAVRSSLERTRGESRAPPRVAAVVSSTFS